MTRSLDCNELLKKYFEILGKNAMSALLAILPMPSSPEGEEEPSEYTICAILGTLQVLTHSSFDNCK